MDAYDKLHDRLKEMRWKPANLCRELKMDTGQFSRAMKKHQGLDGHWPLIASITKVSLDWLLLDKGAREENENTVIIKEINSALAIENARLKAENTALKEENNVLKDRLLSHNPPRVTSQSAGNSPLGAGQIELEAGVRVPSQPEFSPEPEEGRLRSPRPPPGGGGAA